MSSYVKHLHNANKLMSYICDSDEPVAGCKGNVVVTAEAVLNELGLSRAKASLLPHKRHMRAHVDGIAVMRHLLRFAGTELHCHPALGLHTFGGLAIMVV